MSKKAKTAATNNIVISKDITADVIKLLRDIANKLEGGWHISEAESDCFIYVELDKIREPGAEWIRREARGIEHYYIRFVAREERDGRTSPH